MADLETLLQSLANRIQRLEERDATKMTQTFDQWTVREDDAGNLVAETEDGTVVNIASRPDPDADSG